MSSASCVIGVDPGPTTGLAVAYWDGSEWHHPAAYQCDYGAAPALLGWLTEENSLLHTCGQIEEFRPGTGAGARGRNAGTTRTQVDDLRTVFRGSGIEPFVRPAATVKPWATDTRLEKAGLTEVTAGMPHHARDAFRHLLFCAVHDCGVPDPLSRRRNG